MNIKDLRESAGPFFWLVPKWCPDSARHFFTDCPLVHQALHGYSDGHQLLALSVKLSPRDRKTLLVLSDISAPGSVLDDRGHITGYPLAESGFFAIGRTWPALEMSRPGCVWTHTILVDFNDLATMDSLSSLLSLFQRPNDLKDSESYSLPVKVPSGTHVKMPNCAKDWARSVVAALYTRPKDLIVSKGRDREIDEAVFAIWSQQWPRLRRNFRFCTLTSADRSTDGAIFDLQVLAESKTNARSRFNTAVDAEALKIDAESWLTEVVDDLLCPDESGLRSFLRKVGPDVTGGREVFSSLCLLHQYTQNSPNSPGSVNSAVALLQASPLLKAAKSARTVTASAAIINLEALDASSFDFLWENLKLVGHDSFEAFSPKLGRIVWNRDPQRFIPCLVENGPEKLILEQTLDTLELRDLVKGLDAAPQLLKLALARRPKLAAEHLFWFHFDHSRLAFEAVAEAGLQVVAIPILLESSRSDSIDNASQCFGGRAILEALSSAPKTDRAMQQAWVKTAVTDVYDVAQFLASATEIPQKVLLSIALELDPDALPNQHGKDPWLVAWHQSSGTISESEKLYMYAYFMYRSLGHSSRSVPELIQLSFEAVHDAAARSNLPERSWHMLESRLPSTIFWFGWDRCKRIREGIADIFVERELSPALFPRLTSDGVLFRQLVVSLAQSKRGRTYLNRVRQSITNENDGSISMQSQIINEVL